jgi:CrcB protein
MNFFFVFLGGGLGSVARFALSYCFRYPSATSFPWATLLANGLSSLILGLLLGTLAHRQDNHATMYALVATGFCGGFSTFSTFSAETVFLLKSGAWQLALMNIGINLLVCFIAVAAGINLTR